MSYKNLNHTIRDILSESKKDPNAQDLAKLKKVSKIKDEKDVEEKLDEVLEYGTQQAADTYAKDTPGQSAGVEHDPIQHQHKPNLALDGVPLPGGQLKKPNAHKDAGMGKVAEAKEKNCGCGKNPCETYGKEQVQELSSKTMKNYIRKAASPVNKNSAVNLASKGAHKLATSDDMNAGEKEDRKAFNRGKGIQRAAKKLYSRTSEEVVNELLDDLIEAYGLRDILDENKYDLYDSGEHKTAHKVAEKEIDHHLDKAKKMKDYHTARTHMDKVLAKHAKHGSDDSEPHQIVTKHLNNHFGTKHGHNDHLDFMKGRPEYSGPKAKVKESSWDGGDPSDATPKAQLEKERSERLKKMNKKPKPVNEISDKVKVNYINKANKQITDIEKKGMKTGEGERKDGAGNRNTWKRRVGVRMAKSKLGEISNELANKVTDQRRINVTKKLRDAHGDTRDPDYQTAQKKLDKNKMQRFSRGARQIDKLGPRPFSGKEGLREEGRWDESPEGKAYRALSPEEKHQHRLKKEVMKKSKQLKGKKNYAREDVNEAMDSAARKQAAAKIFRIHQAKQAAKTASSALSQKGSAAAKAARRDAAGYKTSDDSHLDKPAPKHDAPKRGRGERDLPHIASQLRGVADLGKGHSGVKFKDGTTKKVDPDHAKSWLKKHDSAKPAQKLAMYKSHDSHDEFMKHK